MLEKNPNTLGAASSFLEQLVPAEIIWINAYCWPMLGLLKQEEQDASRDKKVSMSPCSVCNGEVVSRSRTKMHSKASKCPAKTKHQVFGKRVGKAQPQWDAK